MAGIGGNPVLRFPLCRAYVASWAEKMQLFSKAHANVPS